MPGRSIDDYEDVKHITDPDHVPPEVRYCQAPAPTLRRTDRAVCPGIVCHDTGTGTDPSAVDGATSTGVGTRDPPRKSEKVPPARLGDVVYPDSSATACTSTGPRYTSAVASSAKDDPPE